jgi:hypothetical protein
VARRASFLLWQSRRPPCGAITRHKGIRVRLASVPLDSRQARSGLACGQESLAFQP